MFILSAMCRNHGWTSFSAKAEAYNQTFVTDIKDFLEGMGMLWL